MDEYMAFGDSGVLVYKAEDWEHAVWKAEDYFGGDLVSITKLPTEEQE